MLFTWQNKLAIVNEATFGEAFKSVATVEPTEEAPLTASTHSYRISLCQLVI